MLKDFKKFILRGNVIDLAVGVVIGAAFGAVVNALVKDLITPFIGALAKVPDFSNLSFTIRGSQFMYGDFLNVIISFIIIAITIYFFIVLPMNTFAARFKRDDEEPATTQECPECLSKIPKNAKRCAFCTTALSS